MLMHDQGPLSLADLNTGGPATVSVNIASTCAGGVCNTADLGCPLSADRAKFLGPFTNPPSYLKASLRVGIKGNCSSAQPNGGSTLQPSALDLRSSAAG